MDNVGPLTPRKTKALANVLDLHSHIIEPESDTDHECENDIDDTPLSSPTRTAVKRKSPSQETSLPGRQPRPYLKHITKGNIHDVFIQDLPSSASALQVVIPFSAANANAIVDLTQDDKVSFSPSPLGVSSRSIRSYRNPTVESCADESENDPFKLAKTIKDINSATRQKRTADALFERQTRRDRDD